LINRLTLSRLLPLLPALALYVISLACPAFYVTDGSEPPKSFMTGAELLFFGPFAVIQGMFAWLANPLLLLAWVYFVRGKSGIAVAAAVLALPIALSFLIHRRFHDGSGMNTITSAGMGYWLWLAAAVATLVAVVMSSRSSVVTTR
jgi:hypothetical protein